MASSEPVSGAAKRGPPSPHSQPAAKREHRDGQLVSSVQEMVERCPWGDEFVCMLAFPANIFGAWLKKLRPFLTVAHIVLTRNGGPNNTVNCVTFADVDDAKVCFVQGRVTASWGAGAQPTHDTFALELEGTEMRMKPAHSGLAQEVVLVVLKDEHGAERVDTLGVWFHDMGYVGTALLPCVEQRETHELDDIELWLTVELLATTLKQAILETCKATGQDTLGIIVKRPRGDTGNVYSCTFEFDNNIRNTFTIGTEKGVASACTSRVDMPFKRGADMETLFSQRYGINYIMDIANKATSTIQIMLPKAGDTDPIVFGVNVGATSYMRWALMPKLRD